MTKPLVLADCQMLQVKLKQEARSSKKKSFSDVKYPKVTSKMVGLSATPSKSKEK